MSITWEKNTGQRVHIGHGEKRDYRIIKNDSHQWFLEVYVPFPAEHWSITTESYPREYLDDAKDDAERHDGRFRKD